VAAQLATLHDLVASLEEHSSNLATMQVLEAGAAALKAIAREMPVERVEAMMEATAEGVAYNAEVSAIFARELGSAASSAATAVTVLARRDCDVASTAPLPSQKRDRCRSPCHARQC
jgi:charged multivesicular body protein 6